MLLALQVDLDLTVQQDLKDLKVIQVSKDLKVIKAIKVFKDLKVKQANEVQ